jgi:hypothetical protein
MTKLSSYINVFNTCLVLLKKDGFELAYNKKDDTWTATKGEFSFLADNPIELLGLTAIYAKLNPVEPKEYWWRICEPNILNELDPR